VNESIVGLVNVDVILLVRLLVVAESRGEPADGVEAVAAITGAGALVAPVVASAVVKRPLSTRTVSTTIMRGPRTESPSQPST
jgi:hypothetical protein